MTQIPIVIEDRASATLQAQIYEQIRGMIADGRLPLGSPLPSSRDLAAQLSLSRNTVMLAYARLGDEGYITIREKRGTYVGLELPDKSIGVSADISAFRPSVVPKKAPIFHGSAHKVASPNRKAASIDFWPGSVDRSAFPVRQWRQIMLEEFDAAGSELTEYGDPAGHPRLRTAIAEHLGPSRGIRVTPDRIIVVTGTQMALNIICRLLVGSRTRVVIEDPCYEGAANVFESYQGHLVPVAVDHDGLCTQYLPADGSALVYVTPSHQFPMGHILSRERRRDLLGWANKTGAYILEDDYDADFRFTGTPLPALASMDNEESIFYLGTFSKALGPALRIGFMIVPRALNEQAIAIKTLLDNGLPWFNQVVLARFIVSGQYASHLRRIRQSYAARLEVLRAEITTHFGDARIAGDQSGMHVAWTLPADLPDAASAAALAIRRGVGIYPVGSSFSKAFENHEHIRRTILVGYAAIKERNIKEGISRIAKALQT